MNLLFPGILLGAASLLQTGPGSRAGAPTLPNASYLAVSSTAMGVTGNIRTRPGQIILSGHPIALTQGKSLAGSDIRNAATLFSVDPTPQSVAVLYRVHVPANVKFSHGNTFCGKLPTSYILLLQNGSDLSMAAFAGDSVPDLDPAVLGNSTNLCGTYGYSRK